jgi:flavin-binding protein dodecin
MFEFIVTGINSLNAARAIAIAEARAELAGLKVESVKRVTDNTKGSLHSYTVALVVSR